MKNDPPLHPLVTVAVPAWNAARFIGECVESVLAQTFADFELLIVDDGSDDDTCGVVERYSDSRIRLLRNPHDFIKTRNTLLSQARGKYMAFVDADDRIKWNQQYFLKSFIMKLNQDLKGISFLEEEIPALRQDQEGKLLGGFSAVNGNVSPKEALNPICPTKTYCSCEKVYCGCTIIKPTTPGKEDDTTTKSAAGDMFASSLGLSMLF